MARSRVEYQRAWRAKNPLKVAEYNRRNQLQIKFGLAVARYDQMAEAQGGVCAICSGTCATGRRLAVDHDHATGKIRGLLCVNCNKVLGHAKDDPDRLTAAREYLVNSRST